MKARFMVSLLLISSTLLLSACDGGSSTDVAQNSTTVLDGKATIVLPKGFVKMPKEMLEVKYPMTAQRPQEAWYAESEGGKVSIAFSAPNSAMSESQIPQFAAMMKNQMSAFAPSVADVTVNGKKMSRLEITTPAADGKIYNLLQFSSRDGKLLISTFNTTEDLKDKYAQAGKDALSTLKY
ncbi:hypothetical protein [Entomohabitans teleogrylli]|uniref:hypothetical protein n=1 Tax=Entomohabitans teleogrylli TaxID=1384589 RepID=UPI00073D319A|nr:hypothetical protein [Entomohabitans teleogrylli]